MKQQLGFHGFLVMETVVGVEAIFFCYHLHIYGILLFFFLICTYIFIYGKNLIEVLLGVQIYGIITQRNL